MMIFVYGWYNHDNLGDESYKSSFKKTWPEHEFTFSDRVLDEDVDKYELCIIGGGDVIREKSLKHISRLNCPKISISVTITSLSLFPDIHILDHIYVRDMSSYNNLIKFGYDKVTYIPDISIILEGNKENGDRLISRLFEKNNCDKYNKVYTIVVNSHLVGNSTTSFKDKIMFFKMTNDTVECIDNTPASFLFLPFSTSLPWDDRISNGLVNSYSKFYKKNCVIYDNLSVSDSIDIISASDMIISSRFHGLIFGLGNNIPTVTISFHDKMSGFCDTIGKSYIDYWNFSASELNKHINKSEVVNIDREKIKQEYREKIHFLWKGQVD
jgi:polysaccharide pyruvyl transferase WcaK-like protein